MKKKLEICCYSVESAILAEMNGANRVELCDNYMEGGTTPSYAVIHETLKRLKIPVNVIVRPRGGDFLYSEIEYDIIKNDVLKIRELKANGIVIGFLKSNGEIDIERTREIADLAKPMEVTFHRAFDMCRDPIIAIEQLIEIGIKRILTSGLGNNVIEGIDLITQLVKKADDQIIIMPGSGVTENNLEELICKTGASEYHSSAKILINSPMQYFSENVSMGGVDSIDEFKTISVDIDKIKMMVEILKNNS